MAQQYNCLSYDAWNGKRHNIHIKWTVTAKTKLAEYARDQGVELHVLKGVSEHLIYLLALKIGGKRAIIKNPVHQVALSSTNLNTGPMYDKLCMSGAISAFRMELQPVRVYLDVKSALAKFEELEVVGEAVSVHLGPSRTLTLDLDHSWGIGIKTWTGPTVGGEQPPPKSGTGIRRLEASPNPGRPTSTAGHHRMNPEAAEFYPSPPTSRDHSTEAQSWHPDMSVAIVDTPFAHQYPLDMYTDRNPAFFEMPPPVGGYYDTQIDRWVGIPLAPATAQHTWNPYAQGQKYFNYGTQRWEPECVGFPYMFGYA
ncbi:hypothetical protein F4803DRAFT_575612 [Xylaria telfairii]|nr:hypothetical protein F4803DRAFT_575612 [Xylaria telfairii]